MRVLWLVNVMPKAFAQALGYSGTNNQGWIAGLRDAIRKFMPDVNLFIACVGPDGARSKIDGVTYVSLGSVRSLWERVSRCIMETEPDVIHLHGTEGCFAGLSPEVYQGRPVCASLQGIISGYYAHFNGNLSKAELMPYVGLARRLYLGWTVEREQELWRKRVARREELAFRNIDNFMGRTTWDHAWTSYLNPNASYYEVGEILRRPFYPEHFQHDDFIPHRIYCSASMQYPLKGGHWLLRAVAALKAKYSDVKLVVANAKGVERPRTFLERMKWKQYHRYLNALITELGLWEHVELKSSLSAEEVAKELRNAEVFCLPSLIENSPNSLGEAMMMGVPAVVTDVGGVSSMIEHETEGILVPSGDPAVLAAALDRVFSNRGAARQMAENAYRHARQTHNPQGVVRQLMAVYEDLIKRHLEK